MKNLVWDLEGYDHERDVILKVTEQTVRVFCSPAWQKAAMTLQVSYEACPESKDTKVVNMYNIFNLQKRHCE